MSSIKRELQVNFRTTGDGQVVRSIQTVDASLAQAEKAGKAAAASVGDLSEAYAGKLEGSVGRVFKVTDALNGIMGKVTAAFGLVGIAVAGAAAVYNAFTKSSTAASDAQNIIIDRLKDVRAAMEAARRETERNVEAEKALAAAAGVRLALIDPAVREQVRANAETIRINEGAIDATRALVKQQEAELASRLKLIEAQKTEARTAAASGIISRIQTSAARLAATQQEAAALAVTIQRNKDQIGTMQAGIRTAEAWTKGLVSVTKATEGIGVQAKAAAPAVTRLGTAMKKAAEESEGIGFGRRIAFGQGLQNIKARVAAEIAAEDEAVKAAETREQALLRMQANAVNERIAIRAKERAEIEQIEQRGIDNVLAFGAASARAFADAAAAALVYGASFSEVAAQVVASLATRAVSEALYQGASALAYLALGLATGSPKALAAAKTAALSAAAFGTVAAVTVPVARATGAADGSGGAAGPSARDAGIDRSERGGGGDNIVINLGNQRVFATEADVGSAVTRSLNASGRGRGRPRLQRATMGT